jgi:hypothetical protein
MADKYKVDTTNSSSAVTDDTEFLKTLNSVSRVED